MLQWENMKNTHQIMCVNNRLLLDLVAMAERQHVTMAFNT